MRGVSVLAILITTAPAFADVSPFKTPSGNIECYVEYGTGIPYDIICIIFERSSPPATSRPTGCDDGWGHRFSMGERGVARVECAGAGSRNTEPGVDIVQYGTTVKFGTIVCRSSTSGLECRNADGHGFFLSRGRQSLF
jgi:hypothetical protein